MSIGVTGRIYRVSGPLVIAEDMRGSKVYEVVEVGEDRLIGEIIGVEGDKAIIQVYEDTTGLRVGDPVYGTGHPLAAELGPGLIGSIFDGIQRPLPILQELVGFFIRRGIKAAPLPRDKKWHFKPMVKPGDKVGPGDFLGYVDETEIVKHYIMVPPGVHGIVREVVGEGDYSITDTIAVIGDKEVSMLQKWPVRKPRPYTEKYEPREPVITGQRVIDFFFPLAKGGKAAIPGGFGTGKCVPPGTPVLLADGTIKAIDKLFEELKGSKPDPSLPEEIIDVRDKNLYVIAFDGRRLRRARITHIYRGYTEGLVRIRTTSGRVLEVTPAHKLPVFNPNGYVEYVPAYRISRGDYLVIPRLIPINHYSQVILPIEKLGEYGDLISRDEDVNEKARRILRSMSKRELEKLSRETGYSIKTLKTLMYKKTPINLRIISYLVRKGIGSLTHPEFISARRSHKTVKIPKILSKELAELLGLILSNGSVTSRKVIFMNNDEKILSRFQKLIESVFGMRGRIKHCHTVRCVEVDSIVIARLLEILGIPARKKSRDASIPFYLFMSSNEIIASFLKGYFLGNGGFNKGIIELSSVSREMLHGLSYLLTRLGILYTVNYDKGRIIISDILELNKFFHRVLYDVPETEKVKRLREYIASKRMGKPEVEVVPLSRDLLKNLLGIVSKRKLERHSISIGNYVYNREHAISNSLVGTVALLSLKDNSAMKSASLVSLLKRIVSMLEYVAFDKVEEVEAIPVRIMVYDITVEHYHNFVGGYTPVIYHNTVTLQQLTKWSAVDIAIYVGCGERGNEMADALHSFRKLVDPRTGKPLVQRSVFIANTSNMPVAARETSVFLGATIGEYFRDMGYHVLMVADSTSRWAEAMREISGRLEELPGEEGYPAYLGSRLASFYERSGYVKALGKPERFGSLTIMGAVSPPGADFSEPVTQSTLRIVRALYALDVNLAYRRHYPAINWLISYSLYVDNVTDWWHKNIDPQWRELREKALSILQKEAELEELVRLVGAEALPEEDKLLLEVARMIREDFLQQNAFHEIDTYCPPHKTMLMMKAIMLFYDLGLEAIRKGITMDKIRGLKSRVKIARMKEIPNVNFEDAFKALFDDIRKDFESIMKEVEVIEEL